MVHVNASQDHIFGECTSTFTVAVYCEKTVIFKKY